jgi:hypothetical protein
MTPNRRLPRLSPRVAFWGLVALALLVSHDTVWALQVGPGERLAEALRHSGHDYWDIASLGIAAVAAIVAIVSILRLHHLRRRANSLGPAGASVRAPSYVARLGRLWIRLLAVVAIGFVIQENVEHALSHGHLPGIGALVGPEYPLALPVIALISLAAGLVAALVRAAESALLARIAGALRPRRAPRLVRRPSSSASLVGVLRPRANAGRAPPALLVGI